MSDRNKKSKSGGARHLATERSKTAGTLPGHEDNRLEQQPDTRLKDDARLMGRVASGEQEARRRLLERLYRRVVARVRNLSRSDTEAEDLVQEVLLQILESAGSFRAQGCLEAWVDVLIVRTVTKKMVRLRKLRWLLGGEWFDSEARTADPERSLRQSKGNARVVELLGRVPRSRRVVLVLKLMYGYSAQEVAEHTGESLKAVQYHIKKGRAELRRRMEKDEQLRELFPEVVI